MNEFTIICIRDFPLYSRHFRYMVPSAADSLHGEAGLRTEIFAAKMLLYNTCMLYALTLKSR